MAGLTNFLQHNPGAVNQDSDAAYAADETRSGGIGFGNPVPSAFMNKVWYQTSTMCAAIAQLFANRGFTVSDANLANLVSALSAMQIASVVSVPYSATPIFDASQGTTFEIILSGGVTSSSLINTTPGQHLTFIVEQDGAGNHTFTPPANLPMGGLPPDASSKSVQSFVVAAGGDIYPASPLMVS